VVEIAHLTKLMPRILLVTGEASGDLHGANLAKALKTLAPDVELYGVGGEKMAASGVRLVPQVSRVDAIGLPGLGQLLNGYRTLRYLGAYIQRENFDGIVLIDSPGMNLRLAKSAGNLSDRIFYYIAPQVWAWGRRRTALLRRVVRRVLAILPFEEEFFQKAGVSCTFVGHPLLDEMKPLYHKHQERKAMGIGLDERVIGLFPGSRVREIQAILPVLLQSLPLIQKRFGPLRVLLAQAHSLSSQVIQPFLDQSEVPVTVIQGRPSEVMAVSDCLLMASGTATLQAALVGTPMVLVYKTNPLTYYIAKWLVTIRWIGLVNILAGQEVVTELIQQRMTPDNICHEVVRILENPEQSAHMKKIFSAIRSSLGGPGASRRAAEIILSDIRP
jgi:lipid-A-disaccharide synthase